MTSALFEYKNITDPIHLATKVERAEEDYILVKPKSYENVPIENWIPPAYCYTKRFQSYEDNLFNFEVRKDDVWVSSFPKSGTTWCQEMVWLICHDLDFKAAKSEPLRTRFPFLEVSLIHDTLDELNSFERARNTPSPRFIKTHLPVSMLPKQYWEVLPKTVHIHRNVKSVAVSYFHHSKNIFYKGTKEEFIRSFMKDLQFYSPIHNHVTGYHKLTNCKNILYLKYEDMKSDLRGCVETVCRFFNRSYDDAALDLLCEHLSFDSMKQNLACNYENKDDHGWQSKHCDERFIRRGQIDSWNEELSKEMVEDLDRWTRNNVQQENLLNLFI
ncbi:sulfotransferase 1B1-like [Malaya genurostris]|uniref:sulfotransferase 1B1-like n=1 Tax=Malaya genurostris TaxID=325434 RepID=UPI0026F38889|nr:sulfotransferase 1B1-like [Malaya genurostris]